MVLKKCPLKKSRRFFSTTSFQLQVIVYDHGQVIEDPSLIGRVGFTGDQLFPFYSDYMNFVLHLEVEGSKSDH